MTSDKAFRKCEFHKHFNSDFVFCFEVFVIPSKGIAFRITSLVNMSVPILNLQIAQCEHASEARIFSERWARSPWLVAPRCGRTKPAAEMRALLAAAAAGSSCRNPLFSMSAHRALISNPRISEFDHFRSGSKFPTPSDGQMAIIKCSAITELQ